jgi:hypothetical protein
MRKIRETPTRITCVACQRNAQAASDKLCVECAVKPIELRTHCAETVEGYKLETNRLFVLLERAIPDDPKSDLSVRWGNYQVAYAKHDPAAAKIEAMARAGRLDPLLDLIRLWLAYTDAKAVYQEREQWAVRVEQAIGELEQAKQPRKGEQLIPQGYPPSAIKCQSCRADMFYVTTAKGVQMPIRLDTLVERDGQWYGLSHFTDCPQAKGWSKKA